MVVIIRLKRTGRKNRPCYRICAFDGRTARGGKSLETLGFYDPLSPKADEQLKVNKERMEFWLGNGAQLSETVASFCQRADVTVPVKKKRDQKARKRGVQRKKKLAKAVAKKAKLAAKA